MNTPNLPTDSAPWMVEIVFIDPATYEVDLDRVLTLTDAENAAAYISDHPELTEVIDPEASLWNVWLPNRLTKDSWESGLYFEIRVGDLQFTLDYDPH